MASVTLNGVTQASDIYNYLGQQVIRTLTPSGTVVQSVYAPDGNRIAEYTSAGVLIRQYIWMDLKPVAIVEGGVVYYVRSDHIGRPVFATTAAGTVVWKAAYKPFGGVSTTTGTPPDNRFPGQWFQTESGLYQNWMRNYDPATGRYIQADPLGLVDGASVYGYVRGNPERWVDRKGLSVESQSIQPAGDDNSTLCSLFELCRLMYDDDVDNMRGSGFPGKICHYRCESGKWFTKEQLGRQPCKGAARSPWEWPSVPFAVPPFLGPFAPRLPEGGGPLFEVPDFSPLLSMN